MTPLLVGGERVVWSRRGRGPAVLLLHSLGGAGAMWDAVADDLSRAFEVLTLDAPGHGGSALGAAPFGVERYAAAALAVLDAAGAPSAALVGCSMGSHAALRLARAHPERVRRLVLANASVGGSTPEVVAARLADVRSDHARRGDADFAISYATSRLRPDAPSALAALYAGWVVPSLPRAYFEALGDVLLQDWRGELGRVRHPTLVMTGTVDISTPPPAAERLAQHIPGAKLRVLAGAGHFAPLDSPASFSRHAMSFLAPV